MGQTSNKRSLMIMSSVLLFVLVSTFSISIIARGYRFSLENGFTLNPTGILSAVSRPKGASVYLDDKLITATDNTLNLTPGTYTVKISKDGFLPWQKTIKIKPETVYQADVQLFNSVPDLKPITLTGAINPTSSPDGSKIIYSVASASATKDNGLYLIESNNLAISLIRGTSRQLSPNLPNINWSKFTFAFSPNSRQILATSQTGNLHYLISLDSSIDSQKITDITSDLKQIEKDWQNQTSILITSKLERIPKEIRPFVSTASAQDIQFSSNEDKIFYLAQSDSQIPDQIITPPPAQSTQNQSRDIKKGNYYVYDTKDDTNFFIGNNSALQNPIWLPNSNNLIFVENQNLKVIEYDGTNKQILFASNFDLNCVYPWIDGSKIVILTSPYSSAVKNLYSISIK
jgi:hypothetical protein